MATSTPREIPNLNARTREAPIGEEEATTHLKLGEFENVPTLSLSEARVLLDAVKQRRQMMGSSKLQENEIFIKVEDYLDVFARFKRKENVQAVEKILQDSGLERFENSQLGSLCCESAEEAKTLVPSLANKISDGELQMLLNDITKLRNFVE